MSKRLFISKNESEVAGLKEHLTTQGMTLLAHSFLQFEPIDFETTQDYDILFFSSPRSVVFFKYKCDIPASTALACVGGKTAELLAQMGFNVAFVGTQSGNVHDVAKSFKEWAGDRRVLFPISDISLKTVSSLFNDTQKIEVAVYKTKIVSRSIDDCDTYIFTSPSNVEGFIELNSVPDDATIISWGQSTRGYLLEKGIQPTHTLSDSSIEELIKILQEV